MIFPTIHMNGTSAESLVDQNRAAWNALRSAVEALDAAAPNGRDYYPQGDHAIGEAMREHTERVKPLLKAMRELDAIAEHIYDTGKVC